jgi:cell division protease FtsH
MGPVAYGQEDEPIFLGKEIARHKDYSEETAKSIDSAIRSLLDKANDTATQILKRERKRLEDLAESLIQRETLEDFDVRELLNLGKREVPAGSEA